MGIVKHVWSGRDNQFELELEHVDAEGNTTPVDSTLVQSVLFELESGQSLTVTKDEVNAPINWWDVDLSPGHFLFSLGDWVETESLMDGIYRTRMVVFSADNPDGIVWFSFAKDEVKIVVNST